MLLKVAKQNRVMFEGRQPVVYDDATSVRLTNVPLSANELPFYMGEVPIKRGFTLTQETPDCEFTGMMAFTWQVYDHGEHLGEERERCEFLSSAASDRFIGGAPAALQQYRSDANLLVSTMADGQSPLLESALTHQAELNISPDLLRLENRCVAATLGKSKRIAPFVRCVLLPESCSSHVEVKLMETEREELSWQIGVPLGCVINETSEDGSSVCYIDPEAPVTWRYYTLGHAYSAEITRVQFEDRLFVFNEDRTKIEKETWKGMRFSLLSRITDQANLHISTSWFAATTAEQILCRSRLDMPAYIVQLESMKDVSGDHEEVLHREHGQGAHARYGGQFSCSMLATLAACACIVSSTETDETYFDCEQYAAPTLTHTVGKFNRLVTHTASASSRLHIKDEVYDVSSRARWRTVASAFQGRISPTEATQAANVVLSTIAALITPA